MQIDLDSLSPALQKWLETRAKASGTSISIEARDLLSLAIADRMKREALLDRADRIRVRPADGPLTQVQIEGAINWGRD